MKRGKRTDSPALSAAQSTRPRILVVDDDKGFRVATRTLLEDEGYEAFVVSSGDEALETLEREGCDLLLSDLVMEKMNGITLLGKVRTRWPDIPVIMITGYGSLQSAVEAMKLGATDYLTKPANNDELLIKIRRALEGMHKERELNALREEIRKTYTFANIVTRSKKMREVLEHIKMVADTDVTVLIQGESGTGKELVSRALHFNSRRREHPFVVVNCSAVPEALLESELFGHERGAFTGADRLRPGKFEAANSGTLFLDEIGDLPQSLQTKLLRVLQDKTFERLGGNKSLVVDVRVVAATNRNLEYMVRSGDFREDLYYRLNVFPMNVPPLRERLEDIPLLAEHFLHQHTDLTGGRVKFLSPKVIQALMNYPWRGNVRELENLIKRAIIKTTEDTITSVDLPDAGMDPLVPSEPSSSREADVPYREYIDTIFHDAERQYLLRMLRLHNGNINHIAKLMEVDRKTVYRKLAQYSIDPEKFRT